MILPKFEEYYDYVIELLQNDSREEAFEMLRQTDLITRNFLQINVYFDDRKVTIYNEKMFMSAAGEYFFKIISVSFVVFSFFLTQTFAFNFDFVIFERSIKVANSD